MPACTTVVGAGVNCYPVIAPAPQHMHGQGRSCGSDCRPISHSQGRMPFAMRRSGVRIPLAPPIKTASDKRFHAEPFSLLPAPSLCGRMRTPRAPRSVQTAQSSQVGARSKMMQVQVRGRHRRLPSRLAPSPNQHPWPTTGRQQCAADSESGAHQRSPSKPRNASKALAFS